MPCLRPRCWIWRPTVFMKDFSGVQPLQLKTHDCSTLRDAEAVPLKELMLLDINTCLYSFFSHILWKKKNMSHQHVYSQVPNRFFQLPNKDGAWDWFYSVMYSWQPGQAALWMTDCCTELQLSQLVTTLDFRCHLMLQNYWSWTVMSPAFYYMFIVVMFYGWMSYFTLL